MPDSSLVIRSIQPDDIPGLHAIVSHPQVAENGLHLYTTEYSDTQENFQKSIPGVHRLVGVSLLRLHLVIGRTGAGEDAEQPFERVVRLRLDDQAVAIVGDPNP